MSTTRSVAAAAAGLTAGALLALVAGQSVSAHVTIAEGEAEAGAYTLLTFGLSHGCEGSPTTAIRIQMPESIPQVAPTVNANWDVEKVMTELDEPIEAGHGEHITERVSEVVYTAKAPLADGYRDAFVLSVQVPEDAAGQTLYFPTIQACEVGETAWIEIPSDGQDGKELDSPAPSIDVVEASEGAEHEDDTDEADESDAADGAATEDVALATEEPVPSDDDDGSSNGLAIAGLVAGLGGLGVGGVALARSRRR